MAANVQNALMFSQGKKCRICGVKCRNNNFSGMCYKCQAKSELVSVVAKVKLYDRANNGGSETFIYPSRDILG